jgi:hypothetical protein
MRVMAPVKTGQSEAHNQHRHLVVACRKEGSLWHS